MFVIDKNTISSNKFDTHSYLWFRYHKLFLGVLVRKGRKLWAISFFNNVKYKLKFMENTDPFRLFLISMLRITPTVILFPLRLGGTVQGVPMPISERKQYTFAVKWVIKALRDKNRRITIDTVVSTLIDAIYEEGIAIDKRNELNKTARFNKALTRFFR